MGLKCKRKYLILGAGPAGLTVANRLYELGERDFLVLERESEAGGLCRSKKVDGSPLDIGGGHFLDVKNSKTNNFLFQYMPEKEWNKFSRDSRIQIGKEQIGHPIEANIWQFSLDKQVEYLKSIAVAGCNIGLKMPREFERWIEWKLGYKIAEEYMLPYNNKMFGESLSELGTYWLHKLPNVSFEETLLSCLTKKAYGTQPGHAQFYYPKYYGYGQLWLKMAENIQRYVEYNVTVEAIDFEDRVINNKYQAEVIINTIPWTSYKRLIGMPKEIQDGIKKLKYSGVVVEYISGDIDTTAHWVYYPDETLPYHRVLVRKNFCYGAKGYWTETNVNRYNATEKISYRNQYAYPLNTMNKPEIMGRLLEWCKTHNVIGLGRWGEWEHYNSDVVVTLGIELAEKLYKCYGVK